MYIYFRRKQSYIDQGAYLWYPICQTYLAAILILVVHYEKRK